MNNVLESFISIDEKSIDLLKPKNDFDLYYIKNNVDIALDKEKIPDKIEEYIISNPNDGFNLSKDIFYISGKISLENIGCLYGKMDGYTRVALDDTVLGISINAYSLVSKYNISKPLAEISINDNEKKYIDYKLMFPQGAIGDKLYLSINLYVKEAKTKSSIFASEDGIIIGTIYNATVLMEGDGSIFPTSVITDSSTDAPLWYVELSFAELSEPLSKETVCLYLNYSHKDFSQIGCTDITEDNYIIWKEILTSYFLQIITSLNEGEKTSLYENNNYEEGTIGYFLQYIVKSFNISKSILNNPDLLNKYLQINIQKIIKGNVS